MGNPLPLLESYSTNVSTGTIEVGTQHPDLPFSHGRDTNESLNLVPSGLRTASCGVYSDGTGTGESRQVDAMCQRKENVVSHGRKSKKKHNRRKKIETTKDIGGSFI